MPVCCNNWLSNSFQGQLVLSFQLTPPDPRHPQLVPSSRAFGSYSILRISNFFKNCHIFKNKFKSTIYPNKKILSVSCGFLHDVSENWNIQEIQNMKIFNILGSGKFGVSKFQNFEIFIHSIHNLGYFIENFWKSVFTPRLFSIVQMFDLWG